MLNYENTNSRKIKKNKKTTPDNMYSIITIFCRNLWFMAISGKKKFPLFYFKFQGRTQQFYDEKLYLS